MPFNIVHNDICKMKTDAIVNAANSRLQMGGGVCGAIFSKAGADELQKECDSISVCPVGHAVITKGYHLPAKYVIHAVGPIYQDGKSDEEIYLRMAYTNSLKLAREYNLESIAFPLISAGIYGYPKEEAIAIAIESIQEFLQQNEMNVYLVVFDRTAVTMSESLLQDVTHYIDTYYQEERRGCRQLTEMSQYYLQEDRMCMAPDQIQQRSEDSTNQSSLQKLSLHKKKSASSSKRSLDDLLSNLEESFTQRLLRLIDEKNMTDVQVYKRANLDRKLFSKIRSNIDYKPKKATVFALAIGLKLSLDETIDLLASAGYSFSLSQKFDVIVRYFIEHEEYDIYQVNETLFHFEQQLLGC